MDSEKLPILEKTVTQVFKQILSSSRVASIKTYIKKINKYKEKPTSSRPQCLQGGSGNLGEEMETFQVMQSGHLSTRGEPQLCL